MKKRKKPKKNENENEKGHEKMKRVREKAPFGNSLGQF